MSAGDVTPAFVAKLRKTHEGKQSALREHHPVGSWAWLALDILDLCDAIESAWAERDAYLDEVRMTNENEARIMADLLATREERDRLKTSPTGERIIVHAWSLHDHPSGCVQFAVANDSTIWERSMVGRWDSEFGGWREQLGDWSQVECDGIEGFPPLPQPAPEIVVSGETLNHVLRSTANEGREG